MPALGRHTLERRFEQAGKPFNDEALPAAAARLNFPEVDDLLAAVGRGADLAGRGACRRCIRTTATSASAAPAQRRREGLDGLRALEPEIPLAGRATARTGRRARGIPIRGFDADIPVRFAPDGGAVPGDRIVGILTPGEGITIYPIHSPALGRFDDEPERWVDVRWDISENSTERFPARIRVSALNEPGTLATIAEVIGTADGNIDNLRMLGRGRDFTEIEIDLEVWNLKHLNRIVTGLREKRVVSQAERVNG